MLQPMAPYPTIIAAGGARAAAAAGQVSAAGGIARSVTPQRMVPVPMPPTRAPPGSPMAQQQARSFSPLPMAGIAPGTMPAPAAAPPVLGAPAPVGAPAMPS